MGFRYTGLVKTAHKNYPLKKFSEREMAGKGDSFCLNARMRNQEGVLVALCWVDRDRRYFISTAGSVGKGTPFERERWRQTQDGPQKQLILVPQPSLVELCYAACAIIDQHNRCRQDSLRLEKKVEVKYWSKGVNFGLLGVCIVDSLLLYKGGNGAQFCMDQNSVYELLCEELIDNTMDSVLGKRRFCDQSNNTEDAIRVPVSGTGSYLTPIKRHRNKKGCRTNALLQGRCLFCKKYKSKFICSTCADVGKEVYVCHSETGRECYVGHLDVEHDIVA